MAVANVRSSTTLSDDYGKSISDLATSAVMRRLKFNYSLFGREGAIRSGSEGAMCRRGINGDCVSSPTGTLASSMCEGNLINVIRPTLKRTAHLIGVLCTLVDTSYA
jgi:hypothetical protein